MTLSREQVERYLNESLPTQWKFESVTRSCTRIIVFVCEVALGRCLLAVVL